MKISTFHIKINWNPKQTADSTHVTESFLVFSYSAVERLTKYGFWFPYENCENCNVNQTENKNENQAENQTENQT